MFDISWGELMLIGVVALIVIGPKELPGVLRMVGQWMGKIRRMAGEFQSQFQEAMREAEMADLKKQVDELNDTARGLTKEFDPLKLDSHVTTTSSKSTDAVASSTSAPAETVAPTAEPVATPAPELSVQLPEPAPPVTEKDFAPSQQEPTSSAPAPSEAEGGQRG